MHRNFENFQGFTVLDALILDRNELVSLQVSQPMNSKQLFNRHHCCFHFSSTLFSFVFIGCHLRLHDAQGFPNLPTLSTLWLNNNRLDDLVELYDILGKETPNLTYLSLLMNPCCPNVYFSGRLSGSDPAGSCTILVVVSVVPVNVDVVAVVMIMAIRSPSPPTATSS